MYILKIYENKFFGKYMKIKLYDSIIFFGKSHFSGTRDIFLSAQMLVLNIVKGLKHLILAKILPFK